MVIAFPPGGPADTAPRIAIEYLRPVLNNANLVPVNKPGAGGGIAAEYVARSKPDGHTILATGNSTLSVKTAIDKKSSYRIEDLAPLGMYAVDVGILAAQPTLSIDTIEELIEHARKNPDRLSFASAGQGTTTHISAELFKHAAGIKMLHVPFRGSGPAAQAMLGGHVPLNFRGVLVLAVTVGERQARSADHDVAAPTASSAQCSNLGRKGIRKVRSLHLERALRTGRNPAGHFRTAGQCPRPSQSKRGYECRDCASGDATGLR